MKLLVLSALLFAVGVQSHSYLSSLVVDGKVLSEGECLRPIPSTKYDYPISSLDNTAGITSQAMTCGALPEGNKAASKKCAVNPGSTIGAQWHYEKGLGSKDTFIIDPSHKGPCIVYLAKSESGSGAVWFKIFEDGYNQTTKSWCTIRLIQNKGLFNFKIPTDITPGNYLMRVELIALHEGHKVGGAQPYVHCAEITVGGSGSVNPGNLVSFPGAYTARDAGIYFNIYSQSGDGNKISNYPIPGPAVYQSNGAAPVPVPVPPTAPVTTGKKASSPPASLTTGKRASTPSAPSTTGKKASTPSAPSTTGKESSSSSGAMTGACKTGAIRCADDTHYQMCAAGDVWAVAQVCAPTLVCKESQSSGHAYCVRPTDVVREGASAGNQLTHSVWITLSLFSILFFFWK